MEESSERLIMCHADLAASRTNYSSPQISEIKCTDYSLLGCTSMQLLSYKPMFKRNMQPPSSIKMEAAGSSKTSATSYQARPRVHKFFQKISKSHQNSWWQKCDMKQVPYRGTINIRHHRTKCFCCRTLVPTLHGHPL